MRRTTALLRPARGFSLVELVVVVVVIAVLAAVLLECLTDYAEQAEKASMAQATIAAHVVRRPGRQAARRPGGARSPPRITAQPSEPNPLQGLARARRSTRRGD